jgi:hypothetical protein
MFWVAPQLLVTLTFSMIIFGKLNTNNGGENNNHPMKKFRLITLLLISVCILQCCKKEDNVDFCASGVPYDYDVVVGNASYFWPCFNPNNKNELLFVRQLADNNYSSDLCIYDLATHQSRIICSLPYSISEAPKWGKQDWIVFGYLGKVYQIKSDGTGLQQNPFIGYQYSLNWSPDGNYILGFVYSPYNSINVIDMQGNVISYSDTTAFYIGDWNNDNIVVSLDFGSTGNYGYKGLKFLEYPGFTFIKHIKVIEQGNEIVGRMQWLPNTHKVVWIGGYTIQQTDFDTEGTTIISEHHCRLRQNTGITINNDGTKIAVSERVLQVNAQYRKAVGANSIYLMDMDTKVEERLDLP